MGAKRTEKVVPRMQELVSELNHEIRETQKYCGETTLVVISLIQSGCPPFPIRGKHPTNNNVREYAKLMMMFLSLSLCTS
jgi:hypothetical protein